METKPPIPPFTIETARQKVRLVFDDVAGNNFFNPEAQSPVPHPSTEESK